MGASVDRPAPWRARSMRPPSRPRERKDFYAAHLDAQAALRLAPDNPNVTLTAGYLAWQAGDLRLAVQHLQRTVTLVPENVQAHVSLAAALAQQGDLARASAELRRARGLGGTDGRLDALEGELRSLERRSMLLHSPLWAAVALAAALFILWSVGALLSRAQVARLASLQPHLLRAEQTAGERAVLLLYKALLWFGIASFYVSVPALISITLGGGALLLWLLFTSVSVIPVKLVVIL